MPAVTLKWLMFDFGGRDASLGAAKEQLAAANFGFNARHQKIVFDVTRAYYNLNAVHDKVEVARSAMRSAQTVQQLAESRRGHGLATLPEVLQAREQAARAAYDVEEAMALEVDARMALLEAMGVRPTRMLQVADLSQRPLPAALERAADSFVDVALENRPDLLAKVAVVRSKDAEIRKAQSEYYPRINALGNIGQNIGQVRVNGGPWSTVNEPQYGVAITIEVPLFDAGLRDKRLSLAQSERRAAEEELNLARDRTVREVVKAYNDVKVAFRKREAAVALLTAADRRVCGCAPIVSARCRHLCRCRQRANQPDPRAHRRYRNALTDIFGQRCARVQVLASLFRRSNATPKRVTPTPQLSSRINCATLSVAATKRLR